MPLTPKNRKEQWLEGLIQHETTLTSKNRPEEWMKEIIDASGGGGGTGGVTVLTAEVSGTTATLPCTAAELYELLETGMVKIKISATIEDVTFSCIENFNTAAHYPSGSTIGIDEYRFQSSSYEIKCRRGSDIPTFNF